MSARAAAVVRSKQGSEGGEEGEEVEFQEMHGIRKAMSLSLVLLLSHYLSFKWCLCPTVPPWTSSGTLNLAAVGSGWIPLVVVPFACPSHSQAAQGSCAQGSRLYQQLGAQALEIDPSASH